MTNPSELKVLSTLSAKEALTKIIPIFESATKLNVRADYVGASVIKNTNLVGDEADIFVGPRDLHSRYTAAAILSQSIAVDFAISRSGAAVRASDDLPKFYSSQHIINFLLKIPTICYGAGSSGIHFFNVLQKYGIGDVIAAKRVIPRPGETVGSIVSRGDAVLGIQQVSELMPVPGIQIVNLPKEFEQRLTYCAAGFKNSTKSIEIISFLNFLQTIDASLIFKSMGLLPI